MRSFTLSFLCVATLLQCSHPTALDFTDFLVDLTNELSNSLRDALDHSLSDEQLQRIEGSGDAPPSSSEAESPAPDLLSFPSKEDEIDTTTELISPAIATPTESHKSEITTTIPAMADDNPNGSGILEETTGTATTVETTTSKNCIRASRCSSDSDCPKGRCRGARLGVCNCNACISQRNCESDEQCGGLFGACRNNVCQCSTALQAHGYDLPIIAILNFCGQKKCITREPCFGLPCNTGYCECFKQ